MANETDPAGKAANVAKAGMDTGAALGKSAVDTGASMARTAGSAAQEMGRTAHDATTSAMSTMGDAGHRAMTTGMAGMADFTKMFSAMKMPAMPDMEAMLSAHRRNLETLSAANRVALEGAQAVARRHMEIVQQNIADLTEGMRAMANPDSPQTRAARQAEMLKTSYERAVHNMQELSDLIQRANGEALGVLNKRFAEAMDEVKVLSQKTGQTQ